MSDLDGADVVDGIVHVPGAELCSFAIIPRTPRAAVWLVQDHACASIASPASFVGGLAHAWARAGFATFRADKRDAADLADYVTDVADLATASVDAARCARERDIPLIAFAHGTGATMLTELDQPWAATIVLDALATRWVPRDDGRSAAFHRQLAAIDPDEAWARIRAPLYLAHTEDSDEPERLAARAGGPTTISRLASRIAFADLALTWLATIVGE